MSVPIPEKRVADFENKGFGMFIHWGLYSQLGKGEWVQNIQSVSWNEEEVNAKLYEIISRGFEGAWDISQEKNVTLRTGAYLIAVKRVVEAKKLRGIWP